MEKFTALLAALLHGQQAIAVNGTLMCGGAPAVNVAVRLYDRDKWFPVDDILDRGATDKYGYFYLEGTTDEYLLIDPYIEILHNCEDPDELGYLKFTLDISRDFIVDGEVAEKVYDIGTQNLAYKRPAKRVLPVLRCGFRDGKADCWDE